jgi:hypothetical protein
MGIESYCVSCEENGKTNVLMTKIPFFREVILMAFSCQHCGFRSSEVQSAGTQAKGCRFEVKITTPQVRVWALLRAPGTERLSVGNTPPTGGKPAHAHTDLPTSSFPMQSGQA